MKLDALVRAAMEEFARLLKFPDTPEAPSILALIRKGLRPGPGDRT